MTLVLWKTKGKRKEKLCKYRNKNRFENKLNQMKLENLIFFIFFLFVLINEPEFQIPTFSISLLDRVV